jgi:hypothetical protein
MKSSATNLMGLVMNDQAIVLLWIIVGIFVLAVVHTISDYNTNLNALNHCHVVQNQQELKHE